MGRRAGARGAAGLGRPRQHALYPSRAACDRGHWGYDSCDGADAAHRFPVVGPAQNVGSARHPLPTPDGCRDARALPVALPGAHPGARECVWDAGRPFRGWQPDSAGAAPTSYGRSLREVGGF